MKHNIFYLTLISLLIVSCGVKNYQPVEVGFKDSLIRNNNTDTSNAANLAWNIFYEEPCLQELINEGLKNNHDLKIAILRIEQAAAYYKKSKKDLFPTLSAGTSANYSGNYQGAKAGQAYNLGISASWEIDIWGKIRNAKKSKYASLLAEESSKNAVITQLIADIALAYYRLIAFDTQKALVEETISNRIDYYQTVKDLKKSAQANEVAVLQAEAQLCLAQGYIPAINDAIRATENTICFLLGKTPGPIKRDNNLSINDIKVDMPAVGVSAQLLRNRPDVIAAEKIVMSYHYNFRSARAAMYPSLGISGNTAFDAGSFNNWISLSSAAWSLAAGLTQPLFNGRALRTAKEVAKLKYDESVINFKSAVLKAGMEVSNSLSAIKTNVEVAKHQYQQCVALKKAYSFSTDLLVNNYGTYLDVLTAQEGVFNAQISLIQTLQDYYNARIELYRALGGGWNNGNN